MIAGIIMSLAGGLSLFLFGMHVMSEGIEQAAGAKMRSILEFFTTNRFTGMIVGFFFTAVIQSSSACTALVVAFVNSGLMSLSQAVGVILGSNIGTTVTSQLVSFNLSAYAPAISLIGVVCLLFIKKPFVKKIGTVLIGFGVLFMGLTGMKDAMSGIKEMPVIAEAFASLTSPVLAILLGLVITSIVQSSSVTVSITLLMASQGLLGLPICLYIILGCNIGACSTAMLASLSGNKMAKRAALIHLLFNVIGTIIMYVLLQFTMDYVVAGIQAISGGDMGRCVANAHTIFKIFQVLILFPFGGGLVKLTYLLVPGEDEK
nr:Na/Pi cotransporter family protein [Lachnospiraceae bacterium]